ncbi:MAG: hypothetical protein ACK57P_17570 [Planctomycetota bacterium]
MRDTIASAIAIVIAADTAGPVRVPDPVRVPGPVRVPERVIVEYILILDDDLRAMGILDNRGTILDRSPLDTGAAARLDDFFVAGNSGSYLSRGRFGASHRIKFPRVASSSPELTEGRIGVTEQTSPHQSSAGYRQPTTTTKKTKLHSIHSLPPKNSASADSKSAPRQ